MRTTSAFVQWRLLGFAALTLVAGFAATKTLMVGREPAAKKGGVDNALVQARALMTELQNTGWDRIDVDRDLMRLPEQDYASLPSRRSPSSDSFVLPRGFFEEYEDIAFICDTFVRQETQVVQGQEGRMQTTGFYIVGWKTGAINTYDVSDVRLYPLPGQPNRKISVFPGMAEWRADLQRHPGVAVTETADAS
jgi:hypothetical protein